MSKKSVTGDGTSKPVESKADKFRRLTNVRLAKFEKLSRMIAALANKAAYEYTAEQRSTVERVVEEGYNRVITSFGNGSVPKDDAASYV